MACLTLYLMIFFTFQRDLGDLHLIYFEGVDNSDLVLRAVRDVEKASNSVKNHAEADHSIHQF